MDSGINVGWHAPRTLLLPRGYLAFMDADYATLRFGDPAIYQAIQAGGLEYIISCAEPGRNRILLENEATITLNQSCRSIYSASPYIRITTVEEIIETAPKTAPGWMIATLDAPVIAFTPYIWRHGSRFMAIVEWLTQHPRVVNVTPHTIARYARILRQQGSISAL